MAPLCFKESVVDTKTGEYVLLFPSDVGGGKGLEIRIKDYNKNISTYVWNN
jgi:hypothetical protein